MVDVFSGRLLVSKDGRSVDPEEALQNKVVGLYFSAGWCSPCRDFTPVLCDFYTELLEESQPPAPFEVVFISSDHSAEEMVGYMHSMHGDWLALPFHDPYKHNGLPDLVVLWKEMSEGVAKLVADELKAEQSKLLSSELIFFIEAYMMMYFGFLMKMVIGHRCFKLLQGSAYAKSVIFLLLLP
uniref:Nucleoredoxin like 2 n=1 Tax=Pavo cristatus TaxID=9049 RepID=A0A8C9FRG2_PAVCR